MDFLTGNFLNVLLSGLKERYSLLEKSFFKISFCIINLFTTTNLGGKKCLKPKVNVKNIVIWRQINNTHEKIL